MAGTKAFNDVVAARTRAAQQILNTPDLLARFEVLGGLAADLQTIAQVGLAAEALNHAQAEAKTSGKSATLEVLQAFEALQLEYSLVLGIARAIRGDLVTEKEPEQVIGRLTDIIKNEAQLTVSIEDGVDGTKVHKVKRKASQEAMRAEIEKDVTALADFTEIAARLRARRCDRARLEGMKRNAQALYGKLGVRVSTKGQAKSSTAQEIEMVTAQRFRWGSVYRLLAALARQDERVRSLLKDASR
jgi:hypothetical protein